MGENPFFVWIIEQIENLDILGLTIQINNVASDDLILIPKSFF